MRTRLQQHAVDAVTSNHHNPQTIYTKGTPPNLYAPCKSNIVSLISVSPLTRSAPRYMLSPGSSSHLPLRSRPAEPTVRRTKNTRLRKKKTALKTLLGAVESP